MLPFPVSTNNLFAGKGRRFPSKRYKAWREEAAWALASQRPLPSFSEPVEVTLSIGRPDRRTRDLDNLLKAPLDLLVEFGVLADDQLIHRLSASWDSDVVGCRVEIERAAGKKSPGVACARAGELSVPKRSGSRTEPNKTYTGRARRWHL
jgi:crossover junction endodeoxyribonuclease RusA